MSYPTIIPIAQDYTSRDQAAYQERGIRAFQSVFPNWTFAAASGEAMFLGMEALIGGVIGYQLETNTREAFLVTCRQMVNAIRHAKAMGYSPSLATAAQVELTFTLREIMTGSVTFTAGSIVRSRSIYNPVRVQLLSDLVIDAGDLSGSVTAENSETKIDTYVADTSPNQEYELNHSPYLSVESMVDSAGSWTEVDHFRDSTSSDRHFVVRVSEDDKAIMVWGDGTNGKKPSGDVTITYKIGGGVVTIAAGEMTIPEFTATDSLGTPALFDVTNALAGGTGTNRESVAEIQTNAPLSIRLGDRTVTQEDFSTSAKQVDGIARAMILTSDQYTGIAENYGQLYVVARGSQLASGRWAAAVPTSAQLAAVKAYILNSKPQTITFDFDVLAPIQNVVDIEARIRLRQGANAATVDGLIRANYADYFAALLSEDEAIEAGTTENREIDFGFNYVDASDSLYPWLPWSDLFEAALDASGVFLVDKATFRPLDDVGLEINEFPWLGTITLINDETGLPLV